MAWRFVKQPNGLLARFSEVVDDFTDYDLTRGEALDLCEDFSYEEAVVKVEGGECDRPIGLKMERIHDGQDRFRDAIRIIRAIHGDAVAQERIEQLSKE